MPASIKTESRLLGITRERKHTVDSTRDLESCKVSYTEQCRAFNCAKAYAGLLCRITFARRTMRCAKADSSLCDFAALHTGGLARLTIRVVCSCRMSWGSSGGFESRIVTVRVWVAVASSESVLVNWTAHECAAHVPCIAAGIRGFESIELARKRGLTWWRRG